LEHPLGTFRGLIVDHKDSDEAGTSYRALHDFNWTTRPAPSEGNKTAAERQARKLFNTLTKKGAQKAYMEVIHQYQALGHIEKIPSEQVSHFHYTPHFPVEKHDSNRSTRIRPVYDWRRCNPLQQLPPPQDTSMWPSLAVTRLYPWVAWSDLKNAYLFDRTPVATRRAHGFMVYERNAKGPATLQHYHFMGLPMGSSSSAAALQTTTGILMELSNELSVARVANTNTATPIWNTLVNNIASEEEIQGLPVERLHGPSSAAKALAEVLRRLDKNAR
ncbi:hypothetical protein FOZ63_015968, partial [Perkinsus olseni]